MERSDYWNYAAKQILYDRNLKLSLVIEEALRRYPGRYSKSMIKKWFRKPGSKKHYPDGVAPPRSMNVYKPMTEREYKDIKEIMVEM